MPRTQLVQPSNAEVAAVRVDYSPAGHSWSKHLVFWPVQDHLPEPQLVQPSKAEGAAAFLVEYWPAVYSWVLQLVFWLEPEY